MCAGCPASSYEEKLAEVLRSTLFLFNVAPFNDDLGGTHTLQLIQEVRSPYPQQVGPAFPPRPLGLAPHLSGPKPTGTTAPSGGSSWPNKGGDLANYLSLDSTRFCPPTAVRARAWKGRLISWWILLRRTSLARPFVSTGNGQRPALRVNTLSTPSAFGWRAQGVPHTPRLQREHQHGLNGPLHWSI